MRCWIGMLLVLPWAHCAEEWVFLKDGSVGLSDGSTNPVTATFTNQTKATVKPEDILFRRTRGQVDQAVSKIVADLEVSKDILTHLKELAVLREAATPKLLECLAKDDARVRVAALVGLQYGWSPQALAPALKALQEEDREVRAAAFKALARNVPEMELAEKILPFADGDDLSLAEMVFELADKYHPDASLKRIKRLLDDEAGWAAAATRLSHYLSPALTPATLRLLNDDRSFIRRSAVVGLIAQLADGEEPRAKVRALLEDKNSDLREIAAEYFTWNGCADDLAALNKALEAENDLHPWPANG
ncbi:MAG: hypothetical protein HY291_05825 [Planctomycetes bacterium]|nr:hypothetical protein [Planctomycetota bacterium]